MFKVLITDPISDKGIELLTREPDIEVDNQPDISYEELLEIVKDYDAIITRSRTPVTAELIDRGEHLKVIGRAGVGVDNVDIERASLRGILVVNTPGANTIGATELTISHMLNVLRNAHIAHQSILEGRWDRKKFMGRELYGKTLGIIGLGNIGSQVAIRAKAFGMKVLAYDPYIPREKADRLGVKLLDSLHEMLRQVDMLTIHAPLTHETRNMITRREFEIMKDGAVLINCARGGIVNEEDLLWALESGKLSGVGLDVFSKEPPSMEFIEKLKRFPNVSLSPHIGANTYESQENVAVIVAQQVIKALRGQTVEYVVNAPFPDISVLTLIKPHLDLAEKMGRFLVQWAEEGIREVHIEVRGDIAEHFHPISSAVLMGILRQVVDFPINIINASYVARDRGIKVEEVMSQDVEDFKHYIKVVVRSDSSERVVAGSVLEGHVPRIFRIDNYRVDVEPEGIMLIFENKDVPGVIGKVGSILGDAGVNIAGFRLGREKRGGIALGILNLDDPVPEEILHELSKLPEVLFVKQVIV
ncbi:D-3-phosphoglycerate dehydrogenase [Hydrogenobacter thermophilus TK-6]|uniref:D-3-phosphoglycerate dehydrogenase n=1 Tax=Hydrogenobacter thermophilus (strain DSM 6534 / IAM 12695 / TK-6) TaxID=608538 RepID=D3DKF8_HYDTT|nr:phosphoglycerate dehydrogenase [Hydrogenobacter thermophilus]ADO46229.1 D-3-phosphoglycerate dehydrogenase [Hydrogenobacter thermophilus TK-6]BAI70310.1 D-3-phosphoglycerate dehydrogenase [Hydrogenobacter thermophilus TK-6]